MLKHVSANRSSQPGGSCNDVIRPQFCFNLPRLHGCSLLMVTHEQFLTSVIDKVYMLMSRKTSLLWRVLPRQVLSRLHTGKFSLPCFPSSRSTRTDEQFLQCVKFLLDKCTCSKASLLAFDQVHMSRKNLKLFFTHQQTKFAGGTCQWKLSRVCNWLYVWPCIAYFWWSKIVRFHRTIFVSKLSSAISYCCFLIQLAYIWI